MKYHGKPCKTCGGTLRYAVNRRCVHQGRVDHMTPERAERRREYRREWWHNLSGYEFNRQLLLNRRNQALARMAKRNEGRASGPV